MKKMWRRAGLILSLVAVSALPAYANDPPQPDGLLSLILIFPVAILGFRLAGATYTDKQRKWRLARGFFLGVAVLFTAGGTEIALIPLAILLAYGVQRTAQIIQRGQGRKRLLIGLAVMVWVLFAVGDYMLSLNVRPRAGMYESYAVGSLRTLATAETTFKQTPGSNGSSANIYGSLEDLEKGQLIDARFHNGRPNTGYRFTLLLEPSRQQFLAYAVPEVYLSPGGNWRGIVPGGSWVEVFRRRQGATRTFAVDESGIIRATDLGASRPVTRQEALKWPPLD